jgi:hypothetical protein
VIVHEPHLSNCRRWEVGGGRRKAEGGGRHARAWIEATRYINIELLREESKEQFSNTA